METFHALQQRPPGLMRTAIVAVHVFQDLLQNLLIAWDEDSFVGVNGSTKSLIFSQVSANLLSTLINEFEWDTNTKSTIIDWVMTNLDSDLIDEID